MFPPLWIATCLSWRCWESVESMFVAVRGEWLPSSRCITLPQSPVGNEFTDIGEQDALQRLIGKHSRGGIRRHGEN